MTFILTKYKNRWAILDTVTRVYYFGKKSNLEKMLRELNV